MQLYIHHETLYRYERAVKHSVQSLHLTPRSEQRQRVVSWSLQAPGRQVPQIDAHGNQSHLLTLDQPHDEIRIVVSGLVETDDKSSVVLGDAGCLSPLAYTTETPLTRVDAALRDLALGGGAARSASRDEILRLAEAVRGAIEYVPGATDASNSAASALALGRGVCQDHAHAMLACCRALRVPARYVSGYVLAADGEHVASHAWVDVWLEQEQGWFGFDVTNRHPVDGRHCRLAVGRDYLDACPVRGVRRGGGAESLRATVLVSTSQDSHRQERQRLREMQQAQMQQ